MSHPVELRQEDKTIHGSKKSAFVAARRRSPSDPADEPTLDRASVGITRVETATGRILYANEAFCEMLGYTQQELSAGARTFIDLMHPDDLGVNMALHRAFLANTIASYTVEKRYIAKDGGVIAARTIASSLRTSGSGPHETLGIITELASPLHVNERRVNRRLNIGRVVESAVHFINEHFQDNIDVKDVAQGIGVSNRTLHKTFRDFLDVTPSVYLKSVRLTHARTLLQSGSSVKAAASRSGFINLGHFAIDYRLKFGERPSDTRANSSER